MPPTRVKICGLTRHGDVADAVAAGVWAVGFVAWPESPRAVTSARMRELAAGVPPGIRRVAVVVNPSLDEVSRLRDEAAVDTLQLHGDEDVTAFLSQGLDVIKAVSLGTDADLERAAALPEDVTVMVDAHDPVRRGGTGLRADWARAAVLASRRRVILAGGIRPETLREAITAVAPWAVDVSSGVEVSPGIKDSGRIAALMRAARQEDV